jgi:acetyl-CoA carboxylase biotin carboxyl carrier protein
MSVKSLDFKELKAIVDWINVTDDVREFSLKFGDAELFISRNRNTTPARATEAPVVSVPAPAPIAAPAAAALAPAVAPVSQAAAPQQNDAALAADEVLIKAPMVGTFYAAPKPGDADFVTVGSAVTASTVLCIVEVMKLMNNIEAGVDGTVVRILVSNEQPVQYGQPLMVIKRSA